jgi:hypothetical protein
MRMIRSALSVPATVVSSERPGSISTAAITTATTTAITTAIKVIAYNAVNTTASTAAITTATTAAITTAIKATATATTCNAFDTTAKHYGYNDEYKNHKEKNLLGFGCCDHAPRTVYQVGK